MLAEVRTGPITQSDGAVSPGRSGKTGEIAVTDAHGKYYEAAVRKNVFYAANQAPTAWGVSTTSATAGFIVSNPAGSPVNLALLQVSFALSVAPAAIAPIALLGGYAAAGIVTHTTTLTPASTYIGNVKGYGLADASAALVGTPTWLMPIAGGFTAATLPSSGPTVVDLGGSIVIPPGGWVSVAALTAVTGMASAVWEEIPV
jgi:hypothetical protein